MREWMMGQNNPAEGGRLLGAAVSFAAELHREQFRKGTQIPYILHPLEVMGILRAMGADAALQAAGVLHDTVEDTPATHEQLADLFGEEVAGLVAGHTEDKSRTWRERKEHTIEQLRTADRRLKMLVMADKLSNLRSIAADYRELGDKLWSRFNASMEAQSWYHSGVAEALREMQDDPKAAPFYRELTALYNDVFVKFYRRLPDENGDGEALFRVCAHGETARLNRGIPRWESAENPENFGEFLLLTRTEAETVEDAWESSFREQVGRDLADSRCILKWTDDERAEILIERGRLRFENQLFGDDIMGINGKDEIDSVAELDGDNTVRFLTQLRLEYGIAAPLEYILHVEFGEGSPFSGWYQFVEFCKRRQIEYRYMSY